MTWSRKTPVKCSWSSPRPEYSLKGDTLQVEVRKKAGRLSGRVQDENGNPLSGAKIQAAGLSTTTDPAGHFEGIYSGKGCLEAPPLSKFQSALRHIEDVQPSSHLFLEGKSQGWRKRHEGERCLCVAPC